MADSLKRGTKRKRPELTEEDLGMKLGGKLHHDAKEVRRAAKKAKVFETQKLVKKLKDLRQKNESPPIIIEHEAQLAAIKDIDHDEVGNTALKTKILKDRTLSQNIYLQAAVAKELISTLETVTERSTALAKVQSRLLSSKILAAEVSNTIEALRSLLNLKAEEEPLGAHVSDAAPIPLKKPKQVITTMVTPAQNGMDSNESTVDPEDALVDEAGWESGTVDGNEQEDDWESGSLDRSHVSEEEETSDDRSGAFQKPSKLQPLADKPVKEISKPSKSISSNIQSTFLPSLAMGFVRGGSEDSEWSETEAKVADIDVKKNRRGQRARRAIWEKKYGRNANHKKNEAAETSANAKASKMTGVAAHITSRSNSTNAFPIQNTSKRTQKGTSIPQHRQRPDTGWGSRPTRTTPDQRAPTFNDHGTRPKRPEEPSLHPSWEAKKKLKEKQNAGIVPSQGTKIKFS